MTIALPIIAAPATADGGAISVIRLSGQGCIALCDTLFRSPRGVSLAKSGGERVFFGGIYDGNEKLDEVLVTLFRAPHSYTGEESVEVSCHGSRYIVRSVLSLLVRRGCRVASPGEFTMRAFLNGKIDLAQAEAVADVIASDSATSLRMAMNQMRGGYSHEFRRLRSELLDIASLLELELDFSEEDVEFADRSRMVRLVSEAGGRIDDLKKSFSLGNAVKNGVGVAIAGAPNVGKSTLLNRIFREEKALVSDIAGTTRDVIEDTIDLDGVLYRFIDTAGIRRTNDVLEGMGIERSFERIASAMIVLCVADARDAAPAVMTQMEALRLPPEVYCLVVLNKTDAALPEHVSSVVSALASAGIDSVSISAREGRGMDALFAALGRRIDLSCIAGNESVVSNSRHYEALLHASEAVERVLSGLSSGLTSDLVAGDLREVIYHLGAITGEVTSDEILGNIFSRFCIGK